MLVTSGVTVNLANVQGIVHHFYRCSFFRYLLFRFDTPASGKALLGGLAPLVTSATTPDAPDAQFLNVGITFEGLQALGLDATILQEFPNDFTEGPSPIVMGDYGASAPDQWWHRQFQTSAIHLLVQLSCKNDNARATFTETVRELATKAGAHELFGTPDGTPIDGQYLDNGRLHFGYRDGISSPDVAWDDATTDPKKTNFREFILGYSTPAISSSPKQVPSRPTSARAAELVTDGSYAVVKWLHQDVATFNAFLETEGPRIAPERSAADAEELLAAKLLGRWRDGTPLVLSPDAPNTNLASSDDFAYKDADPHGLKCPFAAHVRVVNPRDQPLNFAEFGVVPKILRRGTPFGPPLEGTTDDGKLRGLIGMFLCSSISAQVYKLMAWMKRTDFSPSLTNPVGQDSLGSRLVPGASPIYEIPTPQGVVSLTLPDFTRTLGCAFFFVPGLEGLRRLSQ